MYMYCTTVERPTLEVWISVQTTLYTQSSSGLTVGYVSHI